MILKLYIGIGTALLTSGPAILVLAGDHIIKVFQAYYSAHLGKGDSEVFIVNYEGLPSTQLPELGQRLAAKYGVALPNRTTRRKNVITARNLESTELRKLTHMSGHRKGTAERSYHLDKTVSDSIEEFYIAQSVLPKRKDKGSKRHKFSAAEVEQVSLYFADNISAAKCPSLAECRQFLKDSPMEGRTIKNVQDKVRNLIKSSRELTCLLLIC